MQSQSNSVSWQSPQFCFYTDSDLRFHHFLPDLHDPQAQTLQFILSQQPSVIQQSVQKTQLTNYNFNVQKAYQIELVENQSNGQHQKLSINEQQKDERNSLPKKTKKIQKEFKRDNKVTRKKQLKQSKKLKIKESGNKSKFNNMGGFLIGSFSQILNRAKQYRISNIQYEIDISENSTKISQVKISPSDLIINHIFKLRKQIQKLPRKEGAKKHLFRLINDGPKDNKEKKQSKRLIRLQLINSLSQQQWLVDHVNSRDFQPKGDDQNGTKKKQRHQSYLTYLKAINSALKQTNQLPKRLAL